MSQIEKLIERIRRRPPEAEFNDVRKLLVEFGWKPDRQESSHVTFVKPGEQLITVPLKHGKVRRKYLDRICKELGLDDGERSE